MAISIKPLKGIVYIEFEDGTKIKIGELEIPVEAEDINTSLTLSYPDYYKEDNS